MVKFPKMAIRILDPVFNRHQGQPQATDLTAPTREVDRSYIICAALSFPPFRQGLDLQMMLSGILRAIQIFLPQTCHTEKEPPFLTTRKQLMLRI